ncbi:MAG: hypothetical protein ACOX66_02795 [Oscillospiraceae bacterium]|jgi:cell division protein FtsL
MAAATARQRKYGVDTTYGNLAYDYDLTAPLHTGRPVDRQVIIPRGPAVEDEVVPAQRVRTRQAVAPMAIVGYLCAAVLLVFTLMAKIQLTEVTDQSARLESQLEQLKTEQNRLLISYEKAFNTTEVETYATTQLGMQRARDDQIYYLDSSVPDKAVVIEPKDDNSFASRVRAALDSLAEYFA